jgi:tetratricopeptide (TPR) repeat protein
LAAALALGGCGVAPTPAEPVRVEGEAERARVRDFWTLARQANRQRLAGDYELAIESFEGALAIDPEHEESLYYLGISLEETGQYGRAEQVYRRMIEVNPESNRAVTQLAALLALAAPGARRDLEEARVLLERAIEINREHSGPYLALGRLDLADNDPRQAIRHFTTAARFGSAEGDLMVGLTHLLLGERPAADARFRAVIAAAGRERERSKMGEKAEGDVPSSLGAVTGPLQAAAVRAEALLEARDPTGWENVALGAGLPADGGRAAWADFDHDGWTDALVCGPGPVRLFRNAQGRFQAVNAPAIAAVRDAWEAAWADTDGDGDLDVYMIRPGFVGSGENRLLRNDGRLALTDVTATAGLGAERATAAASFADLDGDGRLELVEAGAAFGRFGGLRVFRQEQGVWHEVAEDWGAGGFATVVDFEISDFDGDGRLDLFVLPWKRYVALLRGQPGGGFLDTTAAAGLANLRNSALSAAAADFDRDGRPDLLWIDHADLRPLRPRKDRPQGPGRSISTGTWGTEPSNGRMFRMGPRISGRCRSSRRTSMPTDSRMPRWPTADCGPTVSAGRGSCGASVVSRRRCRSSRLAPLAMQSEHLPSIPTATAFWRSTSPRTACSARWIVGRLSCCVGQRPGLRAGIRRDLNQEQFTGPPWLERAAVGP